MLDAMNSALPPDDSFDSHGTPESQISDSEDSSSVPNSPIPPRRSAEARQQESGKLAEPYLARPMETTPPGPSLGSGFVGEQMKSAATGWLVPVALFLATCLSTFFAGAMTWEPHRVLAAFGSGAEAEVVLMGVRQTILRFGGQGFVYMLCVVAILFAHEMGHYVATRIYRIPSTLPFFIPFPIAPIGTMGAIIAMKGQQADRKEIFDIGLAGPIAGLVFAIPLVWFGVAGIEPGSAGSGTYRYDLPLIVRWMYAILHPNAPAITEIYASQVNAMFMAGWVGLLITGLNMLPLSQLDGGHVTYTLFGQHSRWIARAFVGLAVCYMVTSWTFIWAPMLLLVFLIGIYHPPTANDRVPLGGVRVAIGWLSLLIPILCFPPRGLMPY